MKQTASIVVHNTPEAQLEKALDCLLKSDVEMIYIVDNSPNDKLKSISGKDDKIIYIKTENNGYGAGHNIAIREAIKNGSQYHLVMNADVWWDDDVITPILEYLDNNEDVGLVSPKTFYPDGDIQYTTRKLPTPADLFLKRFMSGKLKERRMEKYLLKNHDHDYPLNSPYLLGSFMFFRVKALSDTGLFDERFFMYPEDIDITRRLNEKWKTMYWPGVSIVHEHQQASKKSFKMFWIHFINMVKYFNKWGWIKDPLRKKMNNQLLMDLKPLEMGKVQKGRG